MYYATKAEFEFLQQRYAALLADPNTCNAFADAPIIALIKQMNNENLVTVFSCASHPEKQTFQGFFSNDLRWHIIMAVRNADGGRRARKYFDLIRDYTFANAKRVWRDDHQYPIACLSMNHSMFVLPTHPFDHWYNCITIEGRSPDLEQAPMDESIRWRDSLFEAVFNAALKTGLAGQVVETKQLNSCYDIPTKQILGRMSRDS